MNLALGCEVLVWWCRLHVPYSWCCYLVYQSFVFMGNQLENQTSLKNICCRWKLKLLKITTNEKICIARISYSYAHYRYSVLRHRCLMADSKSIDDVHVCSRKSKCGKETYIEHQQVIAKNGQRSCILSSLFMCNGSQLLRNMILVRALQTYAQNSALKSHAAIT